MAAAGTVTVNSYYDDDDGEDKEDNGSGGSKSDNVTAVAATQRLGCLFLQESSGFLCFPFLWHFFYRNHDSCSAVTFF